MSKVLIFICTFVCILTANSAVLAQQTIFNVPSADVTEKGRVFIEHESAFRAWDPDRYYETNNYSAIGIGYNTELDLTLFNVRTPEPEYITLGFGFKSAIPIMQKKYPEREYKAIIGSILPISLQGEGVGTWSYIELSGIVPKLDTRLSAGTSVGTRQISGRNTVNFIGGIEQPVIKDKLEVLVDWYSGTHNYGFFISGINIILPHNLKFQVGYLIPNSSESGHQALTLELQKTF